MKIGYIILAHQKPAQLVRLLKAIESDESQILLHIDKKVDMGIFTKAPGLNEIKNLKMLRRHKSYWGSFGLVKATLEGIRGGLQAGVDYLVLLSGSDYPIKSNQATIQFLEKNSGKSFFNYYQMPAPHWQPGKEINRIKKYYFHLNGKLFEYPIDDSATSIARKTLNNALKFILPKERIFPKDIVPYGGDQWFCISAQAGKSVLRFYEANPDTYRFLKNCLIPDEIFLQTAIFNTHEGEIKETVSNSCLTFLNWENRNTPSPAILSLRDFENIRESGKLFARKFDHELNPELANKIDSELLQLNK
jgi:hypothetical protein